MAKQKSGSSPDKSQSTSSQNGSQAQGQAQGQGQDAVALLKADHQKVTQLFEKYESLESNDEKRSLVKQICTELVVHTKLEEELFYPACREKADDEDALDEAQVEHDSAKILIAELQSMEPEEEYYDAKVNVLCEYIKHHVAEEEEPTDGIMAKAQQSGVDLKSLGQKIQARKQELNRAIEQNGIGEPEFIALDLALSLGSDEERSMSRERQMQSDERYGNRASGGYDERAYYRGQGDYGQFAESGEGRDYARPRGSQYDDRQRSQSYERGASSGGQRGYGYGRPSDDYYDDREQRGDYSRDQYGSQEEQGRYGARRGQEQGQGRGWFGDTRGHSEASQRGWEERGGSRSRQGGRDRGDENPRESQSGNGDQRGWHGDPRGHASAARRGWQHRG